MSVDSPYCHLAWARQLGIGFPMVSDFNRDVLPKYDALAPGSAYLKYTARRTAFVIDKGGMLRYRWYPPPEGGLPPVDELLEQARQILNQ